MRNHELSALCAVFLAGVLPAQAQPDPRVADLVTAGKIRMGVFPSFQYAKTPGGEPQGLAWGITRALALRLGGARPRSKMLGSSSFPRTKTKGPRGCG
jgi:ABC-type amino acid transport substrate-binding protein